MSSYHECVADPYWRLKHRPKREYVQYLHFDKGMSIEDIVDKYKFLLTKTEVMVMCDYFPAEREYHPKKKPRKLVRPRTKNKLSWAIYNAGYTQEEFAKKVGLSPDYLKSKIYRHKRLTGVEVEWWSDVLHVDKDWLMEGGEYDGSIPEK